MAQTSKSNNEDLKDEEEYMCLSCTKPVLDGEPGLECDLCKKWLHRACSKHVTTKSYNSYGSNKMNQLGFKWFCEICDDAFKRFVQGGGGADRLNLKTNELVCSSVADDIGKMKSQIDKLEEKLNKKVDALSTQHQENLPTIDAMMKKEIGNAKPATWAQVVGTSEGNKVVTKFATCVANTQKKISEDREERQNNVVIFNMKEEEGEDEAGLKNKIGEFCSAVGAEKKYKDVSRVGKKNTEIEGNNSNTNKDRIRPICVTFTNNWEKRIFLSKLRNLKGNDKYNNVRVQHDMGLEDRAENKRLLKEVYELNQHEGNSNYKYKVRGPPWAMNIIKVKKN